MSNVPAARLTDIQVQILTALTTPRRTYAKRGAWSMTDFMMYLTLSANVITMHMNALKVGDCIEAYRIDGLPKDNANLRFYITAKGLALLHDRSRLV
jgi:hypothetical protein